MAALKAKGGLPFSSSADFAVNDGLVRHRLKGLHDARISRVEVVVVPRSEVDSAAAFNSQSPVSIEF
jgi:hypothetical protein